MPNNGNSFVSGLAYYVGDPASAAIASFDVPKGTIVIDPTNGGARIKTAALGTNTGGYDRLAQVDTGGTFVCNGATPVTVANTAIAITDTVVCSLNTVGGTVGAVPSVKTITAATGFTVAGTASDTSTYNYVVIKA